LIGSGWGYLGFGIEETQPMSAISTTPPNDPVIDRDPSGTKAWNGPMPTAILLGVLPGLLLTSAVATAAFAVRQLPAMAVFSPMILAILIGIAFHNIVGTPAWAKPGVTFSLRRLLRIAIILLGLQLTATQVIEVGGRGLAVIVATCWRHSVLRSGWDAYWAWSASSPS
jgi:hypothetical protein